MTTNTDEVPSKAFDEWASEEGINNFHFHHCWAAWQAALATMSSSPSPQSTDTVARWLFDGVKTNLDRLHAVCLEFGCEQGDAVVDWLRARLTAQPPAGYRIRHADGLRWRTLDSMGMPDWTEDEAEALCFSLRHHADAFACDDPEDVRIVPRENQLL